MKADFSRRHLFIGMGSVAAAAAAGGLAVKWARSRKIAGRLSGADLERGHRLRQGNFPSPTRLEQSRIIIAGGGISGLAAGWTLAEAGYDDFELLELEDRTGGNSRSGRNDISAYPLGAHYLPVANREAKALQHLLRRIGMIVGDQDGLPVYDPYQLCADLQERLFWQGRWQEGLIPRTGLSRGDSDDLDGFARAMSVFTGRLGRDGKPAFALPIAYSSQDADLLALDEISFAAWIDAQGWNSPVLLGHLRYCMRDDYGCEPANVSAWAGIHYFAGRRGWAANDAGDNLLTWPEGNDRLATAMAAPWRDRITTGRIVHRVGRREGGMFVDSLDVASRQVIRTHAEAVILAMPHFVISRVAVGIKDDSAFTYAPWVVANISVDRLPAGRGAPLAWDNLSWTSESLGYVVATHQGPSAIPGASVLTWYLPLSLMDPAAGRQLLIDRPIEAWQKMVSDDLLLAHPELEGAISRIDIWRWGHAMIRPTPNFIWSAARAVDRVAPPLFLAHSDLSGLSLFEEAHYQGVRAAEAAMAHIGHAHVSLL